MKRKLVHILLGVKQKGMPMLARSSLVGAIINTDHHQLILQSIMLLIKKLKYKPFLLNP